MSKVKHSPFGFSSLERRHLCPGSYNSECNLPEIPSDDADEGTMLHKAVATRVFPKDATLEQAELISRSILLMDQLTEDAEADVIVIEKKLELKDSKGKVISFGTPDFYCVNTEKKKAVIADHKFGRIPVENVEDNLQLAMGSVALWQKYGVTEVMAVVNQPRCGEPDSFTFTKFEIILRVIEEIISSGTSKDAECIPGIKQCRYCRARKICNKRMSESTELVRLTQDIMSMDTLLMLPSDTLSLYLDKAKVLSETVQTLRDAVKIKAKESADNRCGNYVLNKVSGNRKIIDIQEVYNRIQDDVTPEQFREICTVSIAKLEDAYGRALQSRGFKITLKQAKDDLDEKLAGLISKSPDTEKLERV